MFRNKWLIALFLASCVPIAALRARISVASAQEPALHTDVPTKLEKANVVVDTRQAASFLSSDSQFAPC